MLDGTYSESQNHIGSSSLPWKDKMVPAERDIA